MPCRISEENLSRFIDHTNTFLLTCPLSGSRTAKRSRPRKVTTPLEHPIRTFNPSKVGCVDGGILERDLQRRQLCSFSTFSSGVRSRAWRTRTKFNHCTVEHDDTRDVWRGEMKTVPRDSRSQLPPANGIITSANTTLPP